MVEDILPQEAQFNKPKAVKLIHVGDFLGEEVEEQEVYMACSEWGTS